MTTVACTNTHKCNCMGHSSFAPMPKDTRTIVREEIQRQKALDKLEEKYQAGEISKFEYNVQKAMIKGFPMLPEVQTVKYTTTA